MTSSRRPVIGIPSMIAPPEGGRGWTRLVASAAYGDAVRRAGGIAVIVGGTSADADEVADTLDRLDGLLVPGGYDFDTERLGLGPVHPEARPVPTIQQDRDFAFAGQALARGIPTLGICYGMQLLGLLGGGTLHQHLPDDAPGEIDHFGGGVHQGHVRHDVLIEPSLLLAMVGPDPLEVISGHHQALASVGDAWRVAAMDEEGLIEAIERPDAPFAVGVQWHPEAELSGTRHEALFRGLVAAARQHAFDIEAARVVAS